MSAVVAVLSAMTEPVVAAGALLVWTPAALLAVLAQTDRPSGPAPRASARAARRALTFVHLGLAVTGLQVLAATAALVDLVPHPEAALAWPALAAAGTGALLVLLGAMGPLRRLSRGRAITDAGQLRLMHASLRTAVASAALATVAVVLGAGMRPVDGAAGPYVAPTLLVAGLVVALHGTLRAGAFR